MLFVFVFDRLLFLFGIMFYIVNYNVLGYMLLLKFYSLDVVVDGNILGFVRDFILYKYECSLISGYIESGIEVFGDFGGGDSDGYLDDSGFYDSGSEDSRNEESFLS